MILRDFEVWGKNVFSYTADWAQIIAVFGIQVYWGGSAASIKWQDKTCTHDRHDRHITWSISPTSCLLFRFISVQGQLQSSHNESLIKMLSFIFICINSYIESNTQQYKYVLISSIFKMISQLILISYILSESQIFQTLHVLTSNSSRIFIIIW